MKDCFVKSVDRLLGNVIPMFIQHVYPTSNIPMFIQRVTSCFRKPMITDSCSVCPENLCSPADDSFVTHTLSTSASSTADISENTRCVVATVEGSLLCCRFCGENYHTRNVCPARRAHCDFCLKRGHFSIVCEQRNSSLEHQVASSSPGSLQPLAKTLVPIMVNGYNLTALIDTGSTDSFIHEKFVNKMGLHVSPGQLTIRTAASAIAKTTGVVTLSQLDVEGFTYNNFQMSVLPGLSHEVIIGHDLLSKHKNLVVKFNGDKEDMYLNPPSSLYCNLAAAKIEPPLLFHNLTSDVYPIACKSRKYSDPDRQFISQEVSNLLKDGVIERSHSPWRAQVLVTKDDRHKRRMVIDYSRTINKFTELDAYPLPRLDDMAFNVSRYQVYSALDLKSAYHQIPIAESDKQYTAFEADGGLYQFCRIPFGVTNGVAAFQRIMDQLIAQHGLKGTFVYLDNITVCGDSQEDHDNNLERFYELVEEYGLTLNPDKSIVSVKQINMLGFLISEGVVKPDPDRMQPLLDLPVPHNTASLKRCLGLFSYYSQWVKKFSDKIAALTANNASFPLNEKAVFAFECLKEEIAASSISSPSDNGLLVIESDASDVALSASLTQNGRPVAFFSRTLQQQERKHPAVEKEAAAIVEAVRKWRHYLAGRHFRLITDQQAVSFMFNCKINGKIKNDKILRWRIELSCHDFEIQYRPGKENLTADCLTRAHCNAFTDKLKKLREFHDGLCHPGISRLAHFVRSRNLPYSTEDVKLVINQCRTCAEIKPRFFRPTNPPLIKSTKPFERLSIDFKGPLPSVTQNRYLLVIIDEYSRFPFVFPCKDMTSGTVVRCLDEIFAMFGQTGFIHSDNFTSLISNELRTHLLELGIGYSNCSGYNPRGNGQVERYNGTIWKAILCALKSRSLNENRWQDVLDIAVHSIRTLVCTATNQTPHERLFNYQRRTATGHSLPTWLLDKGTALLRRHVRKSKYDPLVDEVELIDVTPTYARVKHPSGLEQTVSLRDLAPLPKANEQSGTPSTTIPNVAPPQRLVQDPARPVPTSPTLVPESISVPPSHFTPAAAPIPSEEAPIPPPATSHLQQLHLRELRRSRRDIESVDYSKMCGLQTWV
jgi:hypothetical protein